MLVMCVVENIERVLVCVRTSSFDYTTTQNTHNTHTHMHTRTNIHTLHRLIIRPASSGNVFLHRSPSVVAQHTLALELCKC